MSNTGCASSTESTASWICPRASRSPSGGRAPSAAPLAAGPVLVSSPSMMRASLLRWVDIGCGAGSGHEGNRREPGDQEMNHQDGEEIDRPGDDEEGQVAAGQVGDPPRAELEQAA